MSSLFDCRDEAQLLAGMRQARQRDRARRARRRPHRHRLRRRGGRVRARRRAAPARREGPRPSVAAARARVGRRRRCAPSSQRCPPPVERLVEAFWPGGLTIVLPAQPSLAWDLGETHGTVAVRMPAHRIALELLEETGPARGLEREPDRADRRRLRRGRSGDARRQRRGLPRRRSARTRHRRRRSSMPRPSSAAQTPVVRVLREGAVDRERSCATCSATCSSPTPTPSPSRRSTRRRPLARAREAVRLHDHPHRRPHLRALVGGVAAEPASTSSTRASASGTSTRRPTPRLGGVAMFLGVVAAFLVSAAHPFFATHLGSSPSAVWAILGATLAHRRGRRRRRPVGPRLDDQARRAVPRRRAHRVVRRAADLSLPDRRA